MCLKYLIIHSTYTKEGNDFDMSDNINHSYSDVIHADGSIASLLNNDKKNRTASWELKYNNEDINSTSRHVAYVGGLNKNNTNAKDTRTLEQKETLEIYIKYMIKRHPNIKIAGYNKFKDRSSPGFYVDEWLQKINIREKNILQ
jgi:N-acetylmuramoyl-L-alanine amidase